MNDRKHDYRYEYYGPENKFKKKLSVEKTALCGFFVSLFGIYVITLTPENWHNFALSPFSFITGIGMICAIVWAAESIRKISKYGLGTGVPSVAMLSIGLACIILLFSMTFGPMFGPIIGALLSLAMGWLSGKLINTILGMNIPSMEKRIMEITAGSTLAIMSSAVIVAGTTQPDIIYGKYVFTGIMALGFIGCSLAVFHAYNSNLGPDENPGRTRMLSILDGSMILFTLGIVAFFSQTGDTYSALIGPTVTIFMSIVFIIISYNRYWNYIRRDAWKIIETGLLPNEEELN